MKNRILLAALSLQLSAVLPAATIIDWTGAADNNWHNAANWSPPIPPFADTDLVFGAANRTYVALIGGVPISIGSMSFTDNASIYEIELGKGATLSIEGSGITSTRPVANNGTEGTTLRNSGGTINFLNNASASTAEHMRIVNNKGSINFQDNSTAGTAYIFNTGPQRGGSPVTLTFSGNANAGTSEIHNFGENALLHFTGYSNTTDGSVTKGVSTLIRNRGWDSQVLIDGNATLGLGTRLINQQPGATTRIMGNATIIGNRSADAAGHGYNGSATIINSATNTQLHIGDYVKATNLMAGCTGSFSSIQIDGHASFSGNTNIGAGTMESRILPDGKGGTKSYNIAFGNSARVAIGGNASFNGSAWLFSMGNNAIFYIGENATFNTHGNLTSNGTSAIEYTYLIVGGNASIIHDGTGVLGFRAAGWDYGAIITITDHAYIKNANLTTADMGTSYFTSDKHYNIINICGNALFETNKTAHLSNTNGTLNIFDHATYNSTNTVTIGGTGGSVNIYGNATYDSTKNLLLSGADSTLSIGGNANFTASGNNSIFVNAGANGVISIGENAKVTFTTNNGITVGGATTNASVNIGGDAIITGPSTSLAGGNNIAYINGADTFVNIGDNATIKNGRIFLVGATVGMKIYGTPTFENVHLLSGGASRTIEIAMGQDHKITLERLVQTSANSYLTLHFTGNTGQTVQYNHLGNNVPYLAFTEDEGMRANVIHNAPLVTTNADTIDKTTLKLDYQNTITGEFAILDGTVIANHTQVFDTATLNISATGGNLIYGSVLTSADELTLGGLAGDGTLNATLSEIYIGSNNYDSVFSGIVTGPGNVTKIGDGTLSLAGNAAFDNITVAGGYLGLSVNSATDYTTATIGTLNLDTTDQLRVNIPLGIGLAEGTVLSGVLTLTALNIDGTADLSALDDLDVKTDGRATFTFNESATGVYDLVAGKPLAFSDTAFAQTPNQAAVGDALDEIEAAGTNTALIDGFNTLTSAQITEALNELSPAGLAAMGALAHRQAAADLRIITQRFDQYKNAPNAPLSGSRLTTGVSGANILVPDAETTTIPWTAYFAIRHSQGDKDGSRDAPGYDHDSNGISIGIDQAFAKRRGFFGFQFAYESSEADLDYSRGKIELESFRLMTYLGWFDARGLWVQAHASFNMHDYETTRNLPTLGGRNTGNTDGTGFTGSLEIGKTYSFTKPRVRIHSGDGIQTVPAKTCGWSHAPYARLTYDTANIDSFAEYGVLETDYEKQTPQNLTSRLAWRLQWKSVTRKSTRLNANLDLGWEHEYMDARNDIGFRFAGTTSRRTVRGEKTARDSFVAGLNLAVLTARDLHITLGYDLDLNADYTDHRLNLGLGRKF